MYYIELLTYILLFGTLVIIILFFGYYNWDSKNILSLEDRPHKGQIVLVANIHSFQDYLIILMLGVWISLIPFILIYLMK